MMLRLNLETLEKQKPRQGQLKTVSMATSSRYRNFKARDDVQVDPRIICFVGNYSIVGILPIYKNACTR
jgi:hypothetical protein